MKKVLFCLLIAGTFSCAAQNVTLDSLLTSLSQTKEDTTRTLTLAALSEYFESENPDTAIIVARQAYTLATRIHFSKGEGISLNILGKLMMQKANFSKALQMELEALQIFERLNDSKSMGLVYKAIGDVHERMGDHDKALDNFSKSMYYAREANDVETLINSISSKGFNYYKLNRLDSALKYAQQGYDIIMTTGENTGRIPWQLALLGGIQDKMGNVNIALAYYREALVKAQEINQQRLFPYVYQVIAVLYKNTSRLDSAIFYGEKAFATSRKVNFTNGLVEASTLLADLYAGRDNNRAVNYFRISSAMKDSIFSEDKVRQVQNVTFNEELRQQELEEQKQLKEEELEKQKQQEEEERKKNLQFAAIAIGLICFAILFLLLSHSIIVNERIIKFLGIMGLLVVFEFINLLIHPFVGEITHHSPFLMLLAMVVIAAMLVPAHHYLEKSITQRMVEKNKKIRLEAAKRTIEKLGEN